jgi:peptidoglycan/LPS O-acetylase OafA/YrhL
MDRAGGTDGLSVAPSSGVHLAGVEGLRALAAGSIVIVHVWGFSMPHGVVLGSGQWIADAISSLSVGVTLFFTLSGFLLYRPFAASIARGVPHAPIRAYLRNRVLRIAPAYWVILAITALILGAVQVRGVSGSLGVGRLTDPASLLQTGLLLQDYRPSTLVIGIGPAWSLAVEAVFYCVLPLLVLAAARAARLAKDRRGRVAVLLGPPLLLLLVGLTGKLAAGHLVPGKPTAGYANNWHSVLERSFWAQADLFSFGMAVAVLHTEAADGRLNLHRRWRGAFVALGLLVFLPCAWTMHGGEQSYLLQNTGEASGVALIFASIIIPDLRSERSTSRPRLAVRLLETRALVGLGVASYSLYLWHLPLIDWLRSNGLTVGGGWGALSFNLAVAAVLAGGLSALTYRFVERPALRFKRSTREVGARAAEAVAAPAAVAITPSPAAVAAAAAASDPASRRWQA